MQKRTFVIQLTLAAIALSVLGFRPPASLGSGSTESSSGGALYADSVALAARPSSPSIRASAAAVVDGETGLLLWGKDPHGTYPPASMTKMLTALVALEHGQLGQILTSDVDAKTMVGDSVMGLHRGERLPLSDLLYGMLLPSGGDAALVIARAIAGNDAAFVSQMNDTAASLGLTESHFVNPIGLDAAGQLSSPYDMIVVARAAMRFPFFRKVVATTHIVVTGQWIYDLTNTNYFL
ncbi:MAG TPA: D-alanyl-D-alanine carboxypeptidase, partial [Chloroflexota bacterium]|nr:D-alanyl-D-alanine carboxypeptidase [Chloroflexota bacterium]